MRIRDIPPEHYQKLEELAAKNGVSIEEYALRIITEAVADDAPDERQALDSIPRNPRKARRR